MQKKIAEHLWLWCHPAGCYNGQWNLTGESTLTPIGAASYMGIENAVMVVYGNEPPTPFNAYAKQFSGLDKVVWSIVGDAGSKRNDTASDLRHVIDLKTELANLQGGIMDDFFGNGRACLEKVSVFADELHIADLDLWIVLYGHQLDDTPDLKKYLEMCDCINFWTWRAEELPLLETRLDKLRNIAPDKKIALGCYMWDFGNGKAMSIDDMQFQCELALETFNQGLVSEIVMLGSPLCGMDIAAVEWSRDWISGIII